MIYLKKILSITCIVLTTHTSHIFSLKIVSGTHSEAGALRPDMLDAYATHSDDNLFFAGVYDGHIKVDAAHYLAQTLYSNIFNEESFLIDPAGALEQAFLKTHQAYTGREDGATVGTILIKDTMLYAANAGDVQAMLFSYNEIDQQKITYLSQVHTVDQELERIKELINSDCTIVSTSPRDQSFIVQNPRIEDSTITSSPRMKDDLVWRLTPQGLQQYTMQTVYLIKKNSDDSGEAIKPSRGLCDHRFAPYLTPNPFIKCVQLEQKHRFAVLATKNLWLVIEPAMVGRLVQALLHEAQEQLQTDQITSEMANTVAQKLVEKALSVQDVGNQTVTIIFFDHEGQG